jgi:sulfur carrier protein
MALKLIVNGQSREFANLSAPVALAEVIAAMDLKGDRIAVEHNGEIAQRSRWMEVSVAAEDRLEIVHFVGGGSGFQGGARPRRAYRKNCVWERVGEPLQSRVGPEQEQFLGQSVG